MHSNIAVLIVLHWLIGVITANVRQTLVNELLANYDKEVRPQTNKTGVTNVEVAVTLLNFIATVVFCFSVHYCLHRLQNEAEGWILTTMYYERVREQGNR